MNHYLIQDSSDLNFGDHVITVVILCSPRTIIQLGIIIFGCEFASFVIVTLVNVNGRNNASLFRVQKLISSNTGLYSLLTATNNPLGCHSFRLSIARLIIIIVVTVRGRNDASLFRVERVS